MTMALAAGLSTTGEKPPKHVTPSVANHGKTQISEMVPLAKTLARLVDAGQVFWDVRAKNGIQIHF
jgi:hypothetical protein